MFVHSPGITLLLLAIAIPLALAQGGNGTCYWPNGSQAPDFRVPCNPDSAASHCCISANHCLTNGLCVRAASAETGVDYERGACTDPTWKDPSCPSQLCPKNHDTGKLPDAYDFAAGEVRIWQCGVQGFARPANYCCESAAEGQRCCSTTSILFPLPSASIGEYTGLPASFSATTTTTPTFTGGPSSPQTTPISTSTLNVNPPKDNGGTDAAVIGGAVGGAIGGITLAVAVVIFLMKRRNKMLNRNTAQELPVPLLPYQYGSQGYPAKETYGMRQPEAILPPTEIPASQSPQELPSDTVLHFAANPQTI